LGVQWHPECLGHNEMPMWVWQNSDH
jgi:gamma-glutamyl-gamma-aminobutyrate hydrolase PuuD